jgi:hypothetical protein
MQKYCDLFFFQTHVKKKGQGPRHPTLVSYDEQMLLNSWSIFLKSRFIKLLRIIIDAGFWQSSQYVEMMYYRASPRSHCPQLWFRTQLITIGLKTFTIVSQTAQVLGEGMWLCKAIIIVT